MQLSHRDPVLDGHLKLRLRSDHRFYLQRDAGCKELHNIEHGACTIMNDNAR